MKRLIVITGVSRGLGRALAVELIRRGHTILGCARDSTRIEELTARFAEPHRFRTVDVTSDDQVGAWAESLRLDGRVPDLVVNNAALINSNAKLWEVSPDEFTRVVEANVIGTYHMIRHFVPLMIEAGNGTIINFSSTWGRSTAPDVAPYCATKWAIEGLTRSLAQELPPGLSTVALNPGVIDTDMLRSCFGASAAGFPSPEQWARSAAPFILALGVADSGRSVTVP